MKREPVTIVGVDPGKTTGVACYHRGKFESLQLDAADAVPYLLGWVEGMVLPPANLVHVAAERFVRGSANGHHNSGQDDASEVLNRLGNGLRDLQDRNVRFHLQGAGDAKLLMTNERLRGAGWYKPGLVHANDAARHLGLRMLRLFPLEYIRVMAGENRLDELVKEG